MLTEKVLTEQLKAAGITPADTVIVHTSLRAVGEIEGGGDGLIDMFRNYLNKGLFLVPTHTWASVNYGQPVFDVRKSEPCIGTLPKLAALRSDGFRSLNPTHSMTAFGDGAEEYISNEQTIRTPAPQNGCWGRLAECNAKILLIGVGLERNTFIHSVDEMAGTPNRLSDDEINFTDIDRNGRRIPHPMRYVCSRGIDDVSRFFPKFEELLKKEKAVSYAKIGNADSLVCDARRTAEVLVALFTKAKRAGVELCCDMRPVDELI